MKKKSQIKETLLQIQNNQSFDLLDQFRESKSWKQMGVSDKALLAQLFVMQGAKQMRSAQDAEMIESFKIANKLSPNDCHLLLTQAIVCFDQSRNINLIKIGCQILEQVLEIDPGFYRAWHAWGNALVRLALYHEDKKFLLDANEKFSLLENILKQAPIDFPDSFEQDYLWDWGVCLCHMGKFSGEASDFYAAVMKFREAHEKGLDSVEFWNDYGCTLCDLSHLVNNPLIISEALDCFRKAIRFEPKGIKGLLNLAKAYLLLYNEKEQEEDFFAAYEAFNEVSKIDKFNTEIWFRWGQLLLNAGKLKKHMPLIHASLEKFSNADTCESQNPGILSEWAEALVILGGHHDKIELLFEARQKVALALKLDSQDGHIWGIYGACQKEIARYFSDVSMYEKALEAYQKGTELLPNSLKLWEGIGSIHFILGEMTNDPEILEQASRICAKIITLSNGKQPEFWANWGLVLLKLAEINPDRRYIEAAIKKFESALEFRDHKDFSHMRNECFYNYACAIDFLGHHTDDPEMHEKAINLLTELVDAEPEAVRYRYNLALALVHLGELISDIESIHKSLGHFEIIIEIDPEDDVCWNEWGLSLVSLAQLLDDQIQPEQLNLLYIDAEEKFLKAVHFGCAAAYYNLACLHSLRGNFELALNFLERGLKHKALPPLIDIMHDEWLDGLKNQPAFEAFLHNSLMKELKEYESNWESDGGEEEGKGEIDRSSMPF